MRSTHLAEGRAQVEEIAREVLSEVTVKTLELADHLPEERAIRPWLLRIATNLVKQKRADYLSLVQHEVSASTLESRQSHEQEEVLDWFDSICDLAQRDPGEVVAERDHLERLLAELMPEDRSLIEQLVLAGMDAEAVALNLGVQMGTLRTRLHRALRRLRYAATQLA